MPPKMTDVFTTPRTKPVGEAEGRVIEFIRKTVLRFCRPSKIVLFGSRARDNFREDSDYDIFVLFPPGEKDGTERERLRKEIEGQLDILKDTSGHELVDLFVEDEVSPDPDPDSKAPGMYAYNAATFPQRVIYP